MAILNQLSEIIKEVLISTDCCPFSNSKVPWVRNQSYICIVITWRRTWLIDCSFVVFILVDLNSKVHFLIPNINDNAFSIFHDFVFLASDEPFCQILLSIEFRDIVAAESVFMEVGSSYSNNVSVIVQEIILEFAVNKDISFEFNQVIILVYFLIVFQRKGVCVDVALSFFFQSNNVDLIWVLVQSKNVV